MNDISPVVVTRDLILNPGVNLDGKLLTTVKVTLLTLAQRNNVAALPETERDAQSWIRSIAQFGHVTERTTISALADALVVTDEARIRQAILLLEADCLADPVDPKLDPLTRIMSATDIVSEPFALNPGIVIDGKPLTSCIVRLLTRGELKKVLVTQAETAVQADIALFHEIVQLGDQRLITMDHINALTDPDIERIANAVEELRAQHAPETKRFITCPDCGHEFHPRTSSENS